MNIRQAMKIEANSNSDVKLSKFATTVMNGNRAVIDKSLDNYKVTDWFGLALNPLLDDDDIRNMYNQLNDAHQEERKDRQMKDAVKTRNSGSRAKVKRLLSQHPGLGEETIDQLLQASTFGTPKVLNNPNITKKQLDTYFDKKILGTAQGAGYNFVTFKEIMKTKHITEAISLGWYNKLKEFADWEYKDNQWYAIVDAYLDFDDCPYEILEDICKAPPGLGDGSYFDRPEDYRKNAIKHPKAKPELKNIAYATTEFVDYISDDAKEMFLF